MTTNPAREAWTIVRCPVCGHVAEDIPEDGRHIEACNGVAMGGRDSLAFDEANDHPSDHAVTAVEQFAVVPLDAVVQFLIANAMSRSAAKVQAGFGGSQEAGT